MSEATGWSNEASNEDMEMILWVGQDRSCTNNQNNCRKILYLCVMPFNTPGGNMFEAGLPDE